MEQQSLNDKKSALEAGLRMHTGTSRWFRHWLRQFTYTEGVQHLAQAQEASAYWLLDLIGSRNMEPALLGEEFIVWKLKVHPDQSAVAIAEDGNGRELSRQEIPWTDFPLDEVTLYLTDRVLLLPSEY